MRLLDIYAGIERGIAGECPKIRAGFPYFDATQRGRNPKPAFRFDIEKCDREIPGISAPVSDDPTAGRTALYRILSGNFTGIFIEGKEEAGGALILIRPIAGVEPIQSKYFVTISLQIKILLQICDKITAN